MLDRSFDENALRWGDARPLEVETSECRSVVGEKYQAFISQRYLSTRADTVPAVVVAVDSKDPNFFSSSRKTPPIHKPTWDEGHVLPGVGKMNLGDWSSDFADGVRMFIEKTCLLK